MLKSKLHGCLFHGGSVIVKRMLFKVGKWDERLIRNRIMICGLDYQEFAIYIELIFQLLPIDNTKKK